MRVPHPDKHQLFSCGEEVVEEGCPQGGVIPRLMGEALVECPC